MRSSLDAPQTGPVPPPPHSQAPDWYERQQSTNSPAKIGAQSAWLARDISSEGCSYEQIRPNRDFAPRLRSLQQYYAIQDSVFLVLELLAEEPVLYALLIEAVEPLQHAFGSGRILKLRVQISDDDSFVKVAVQLPQNLDYDPERALGSFDAGWWLNNCHRSGGALLFDYEIQDAV